MKRLTDYGRRRGAALAPLGENGNCFVNAATTVATNPGLTYVEGFATAFGIPMHHGWVEGPRGAVLEVTPTWRERNGAHADTRYFGGLRRTHEEVRARVFGDRDALWGEIGWAPGSGLDRANRAAYTHAFGAPLEELFNALREVA